MLSGDPVGNVHSKKLGEYKPDCTDKDTNPDRGVGNLPNNYIDGDVRG